MKTKCIIVDDEPLAIEVIKSYLNKIDNMEIVAECESAIKAFDYLKKQKVDLMFLDIQMPEFTGLDFLKTINNPPKVIITTAYRKYALDGFELNVIDYLLKPIPFDRFLKAIDKYYEISAGQTASVLQNQNADSGKADNFIYVKENRKMVKVKFNDILFIESMKDYSIIHKKEKKVITKIPLSMLEEKLPGDKFLRIHRSFIVSISKVEAFTPVTIEIGKKELTIGRNYKNSVLKTLHNFI